MFQHMLQHTYLTGSLQDQLLDIQYADWLRWIRAIWGQKCFWKLIGTERFPCDPPRLPFECSCALAGHFARRMRTEKKLTSPARCRIYMFTAEQSQMFSVCVTCVARLPR
jgi:hypothetical protein